MENEHPIAHNTIPDNHKAIIASQIGARSVRGINNIICRDPFVANESLIRKILKRLHPRNTLLTCDLIFHTASSSLSIDTDNMNLFICNTISFSGLCNSSQEALKDYMKSLLEREKYRVVLLEDGEIQDYSIRDNRCYWQSNQVRVIDLIAVLFPNS